MATILASAFGPMFVSFDDVLRPSGGGAGGAASSDSEVRVGFIAPSMVSLLLAGLLSWVLLVCLLPLSFGASLLVMPIASAARHRVW